MVRAERIIDQLWPDADGDDARNSFKMTLSRLRRLLPEEAILYHDGMFSLNRRLVWTDVWAYENLTDRAEALWGKVTHSSIKGKEARTCISEAMDLSDKAINLYQGEFLPGDAAQVWAAAPRERLRGKLLRLITLIGRHHEDKGRWKSAAGFYGRGLEADCLQEEFYYCLMKCHIHLGQHPQALATYERCCAELSAALDIAPSMKTQSLYATISNQK